MLDAYFATAMVVMGFLFPLGVTVLLLIELFTFLDEMFLTEPMPLLSCSTTAGLIHLQLVSLDMLYWPLRFIPHQPHEVASYKCRWQLGLSLFFKPLDDATASFRFFEGFNAVLIDSFGNLIPRIFHTTRPLHPPWCWPLTSFPIKPSF